jgi:hypothetical protein
MAKISNNDLAAIHGYLCSDGYVVKNPQNQKHKYYVVGLRNTNIVLLRDFQQKVKKVFPVNPIIYRNERCKIHSKLFYAYLSKYGSYYSGRWTLPSLSKKALASWLRAYFDCDGWVFCEKHKNRNIGLDSINKRGIKQIKEALGRLQIESVLKERRNKKIWRLYIYKRKSLERFSKLVGFTHPEKKKKLKLVLESYVNHRWAFPKKNKIKHIKQLMAERAKRMVNGIIRVNSIVEKNLIELKGRLKSLFKIESKVYGPRTNGYGTRYYELVVQKKEHMRKAAAIFSV